MKKIFGLGLLWVSLIMQLSCVSVPHMVLPQKDIEPFNLNEQHQTQKVLVAARSSEFKEALVAKIKANYQDQPVFVRFMGLNQLKQESAGDYRAVVLINTCWSWDMDRNVKAFLKRTKNQNNLIVLTTSGSGDWQPKKKEQNFDAVSAASQKANVDVVAATIIEKIDSLLHASD